MEEKKGKEKSLCVKMVSRNKNCVDIFIVSIYRLETHSMVALTSVQCSIRSFSEKNQRASDKSTSINVYLNKNTTMNHFQAKKNHPLCFFFHFCSVAPFSSCYVKPKASFSYNVRFHAMNINVKLYTQAIIL